MVAASMPPAGARSVRALLRFGLPGAALGESRARGLQQYFGERVAPGGAGEDEGTDHGAELGQAVVIAGGQPSGAVAYPVYVDVAAAGGLTGLTPQVSGESRNGAAVPGVIAVPDREVVLDQRPAGGLVLLERHRRVCRLLVEGVGDGLVDQVLLGGELLVEPAMGEPGGLHQVGDADRGAFLAEHPGGGGYDALPVLLCLRPGHAAHGITLLKWMSLAIHPSLRLVS